MLELFEETHRQRLTESAPWGCCKSADFVVKLLGGSSEATHGKRTKKKKRKEERKLDQNRGHVNSDWKHFRQLLESKQRKRREKR